MIRFIDGLRPELREQMIGHTASTYSALVQMTEEVERSLSERGKAPMEQSRGPRQKRSRGSHEPQGLVIRTVDEPPRQSRGVEIPIAGMRRPASVVLRCPECGRRHADVSRLHPLLPMPV